MHTHRLTFAAALAATLALGLSPAAPGLRSAHAQEAQRPQPSQEDLDRARAAYMEGAALIEQEKFAEAVDKFKESFRLSRNPLLLYNIGWTLDQGGEPDKALFYYQKFLSDAPQEAAQRDFVSKRVKELERESEADALFSGGAKPAPAAKKGATPAPAEAAPPAAEVSALQHKVVDAAPPRKPLDLTAFAPDDAGWQVTLFYRSGGDAKFASVAMRARYNELVGRIPAAKMTGSSIQYYIEAKDRSGQIVDRSGRATSPHLVLVDEDAAPMYYPDLTEERDWDSETTGSTGGSGIRVNPGPGSWSDVQSTKYQYAKWGATGGAVGMLTLSVSFYLLASNASSSLEAEAHLSNTECPMRPCRAYSDAQKDLAAKGERYDTLANVSLGLGVVSAGVAGYLWYREFKTNGKERSGTASRSTDDERRLTAVPVATPDFVGGAAALRF